MTLGLTAPFYTKARSGDLRFHLRLLQLTQFMASARSLTLLVYFIGRILKNQTRKTANFLAAMSQI